MNLAWTGQILPPVLYLQVIWAIGLAMIALAGLLWLPRAFLVGTALLIMLGHNLLDGIVLAPDQAGYTSWAILHQRGLIDLPWGVARTSYPVLPWIGVAAAGYALGPWYALDPGPGEAAPRPRGGGAQRFPGAARAQRLRRSDAWQAGPSLEGRSCPSSTSPSIRLPPTSCC